MDRRQPGSLDASGNIHVSLESSAPCWNDTIEELTKTDPKGLSIFVFQRRILVRGLNFFGSPWIENYSLTGGILEIDF